MFDVRLLVVLLDSTGRCDRHETWTDPEKTPPSGAFRERAQSLGSFPQGPYLQLHGPKDELWNGLGIRMLHLPTSANVTFCSERGLAAAFFGIGKVSR